MEQGRFHLPTKWEESDVCPEQGAKKGCSQRTGSQSLRHRRALEGLFSGAVETASLGQEVQPGRRERGTWTVGHRGEAEFLENRQMRIDLRWMKPRMLSEGAEPGLWQMTVFTAFKGAGGGTCRVGWVRDWVLAHGGKSLKNTAGGAEDRTGQKGEGEVFWSKPGSSPPVTWPL